MTHTLIYPSNSRHNSAGHLEVDGCDVVELAEHYGTPLIVYEEKTIRDQCRRLEQGFSRRTDDYEVIYATKALCTICLLYTSDAADDLLCVDLGGRRIIKKKKRKQ